MPRTSAGALPTSSRRARRPMDRRVSAPSMCGRPATPTANSMATAPSSPRLRSMSWPGLRRTPRRFAFIRCLVATDRRARIVNSPSRCRAGEVFRLAAPSLGVVFCLSEAFAGSLVRGLVSREVTSCDELLLRPLGDHLHPDAFVGSSLGEWLPTSFRGFPSSWKAQLAKRASVWQRVSGEQNSASRSPICSRSSEKANHRPVATGPLPRARVTPGTIGSILEKAGAGSTTSLEVPHLGFPSRVTLQDEERYGFPVRSVMQCVHTSSGAPPGPALLQGRFCRCLSSLGWC